MYRETPQIVLRFGLSPRTVRNWEQGIRHPEGPARILLQVIDREPEAVMRALRGGCDDLLPGKG